MKSNRTTTLLSLLINLYVIFISTIGCNNDIEIENVKHTRTDFKNSSKAYWDKGLYDRITRLKGLYKNFTKNNSLKTIEDRQIHDELNKTFEKADKKLIEIDKEKKTKIIKKYNLEKKSTKNSTEIEDYNNLCQEAKTLKDYDQLSCDEEILCESFNLRLKILNKENYSDFQEVYFLGNSIHKEFAFFCDLFRREFYRIEEYLIDYSFIEFTNALETDLMDFFVLARHKKSFMSSLSCDCDKCKNEKIDVFLKKIIKIIKNKDYAFFRNFNDTDDECKLKHFVQNMRKYKKKQERLLSQEEHLVLDKTIDQLNQLGTQIKYMTLTFWYNICVKKVLDKQHQLKKEKMEALDAELLSHESYYDAFTNNLQNSYFAKYKADVYDEYIKEIPSSYYKKGYENGKRISNFAMGGLSYLKDGKPFTKEPFNNYNDKVNGKIPSKYQVRSTRSNSLNEDAEVDIFNSAYRDINDKKEFFQSCDYVILDLHTYLSMCVDCRDIARKFIDDVNSLIGANKLKIRVSYTKKYYEKFSENFNESGNRVINYNEYIYQKMIEHMPIKIEPKVTLVKYNSAVVFCSKGMQFERARWENTMKSLEDTRKKEKKKLEE